MAGKMIVIEGISSSGKKTQAELLLERLKREGKTAELIHFPSYDKTLFGSLVGKYLNGEFGSKEDLPEVACLLYALDRYQFKKQLEEKLAEGVYVILDRYSQSNMGFQGAFFNGAEFDKMIDWIQSLESRLPQADAVVFLDTPRKFTEKLIEKREKKNVFLNEGDGKDVHEKDAAYEERVREAYLRLAEKLGWIMVECVENGVLKSPAEVSELVWSALKKKRIV
ncbi:thymidylate kinase [Candidatus Micrarchaeota archaeon]|nr:thymidylate kinase [Candidatus Micrarchaeota archaeon]